MASVLLSKVAISPTGAPFARYNQILHLLIQMHVSYIPEFNCPNIKKRTTPAALEPTHCTWNINGMVSWYEHPLHQWWRLMAYAVLLGSLHIENKDRWAQWFLLCIASNTWHVHCQRNQILDSFKNTGHKRLIGKIVCLSKASHRTPWLPLPCLSDDECTEHQWKLHHPNIYVTDLFL